MTSKRSWKKPLPFREQVRNVIEQAIADGIEYERMQLERHLRNGMDNGVPAETLAAVFEISVEEIQHFEQHGHLEE